MPFIDRINDDLKSFLEEIPVYPLDDVSIQDVALLMRSRPVLFPLEQDDSIEIIDNHLPTSGVLVRTFKPSNTTKGIPVFVYYYGGGFLSGSIAHNESLCQQLALSANCAVVCVEYRKAPEYPYPAGFDDCYDALAWVADNDMFDSDRIVIGGVSAGGCMAAGVALRARDEGIISVQGQMLIIPGIDHRFITPSSTSINDPRVWHIDLARRAWDSYLVNVDGDIPAYASPPLAKDLSGLPPAFVSVEAEDILRDEGVDYAQRLMTAGVQTELHVYPGAFHASFAFIPQAKTSQQHLKAITEALCGFFV